MSKIFDIKKIFEHLKNEFINDKLEFILRYLTLFITFVFLVTLPVFTSTDDNNIITNVLAIVVAICAFAYMIFRGKIVFNYYICLMIIFFLYCFIVTLIGTRDFTYIRRMFTVYCISIVIFTCIVNFKNVSFYIFSLICGILVLCISIFITYRSDILSLNLSRLGSEFGNVNSVGRYTAIGVAFLGYIAFKKRGWYFSLLILIALFLFFTILTGSKGAIIIAFLSIIINLYFLFGRKKLKWYILSVVVLIGICVGVLFLPIFSEYLDRFINMFNTFFNFSDSSVDGSTTTRLLMILDGIYMSFRNLIFGGGSSYFAYASSFNVYSHSNISELLANTGLVGFSLFYLIYLIPLFNKRKSKTKELYAVFFILFIIVYSFMTILYFAKLFNIIFSILFGSLYLEDEDNCKHVDVYIRFKKNFFTYKTYNFKSKFLRNDISCNKEVSNEE